ncbi:acyloxyacyl hydrolase [Trinickia caryophylli]|uniref:Lipid A deacylase n=1 Tax=Trinickia caryophylli TaxID=28094 RepID=A0A1X7ER52_TRICW|nr:acyloxyacyl hydrolase [Trinickia caryophylli]PMS10200.1 acyloxyacyl hydrolase [Trinickia caryophylli]TRX18673.1 acyloxyacyl hydrolase [Trinickia caryophylli]WQE10532.1 acyloxyacyl hydrolase [Trinickia caryophylli]SMF38222.1 lipid A 3-O-deacylase [Trinickia caryophylli]GLU32889.1 lipid A deacylase [Trinickia caryophylli]
MQNKNRNWLLRSTLACAGAAALSAATAAHADTFGVQVAGGISDKHHVDNVDLGFVWDPGINWWEIGGWHFSLVGEAHVAYWHPTQGASRRDVYEIGVSPMVRFIKSSGAIRPYIEAGAGVRGLTHAAISDSFSLGTAFQFTETVGVGAQFGARQQYQAGFRFQHVSNGGIKEPNPGINFSQLYLQYNF